MVCELVNEAGANQILNTSLNYAGNKYLRSHFVFTQSDTTDPLHQMVFYNREKLLLLQQAIYPTTVRDINHYSFLLNTTDRNTDSVFLDAFVVHLKSSDGVAERSLRLGMVDTLFAHLNQVPLNHYILIGGDFNFYNAANEGAYQKLTDTTNPFIIVDPIHAPGKWHDNDSFQAIHTQATRISTAGFGTGGAGGGMDDRFDYIMMSQNLEQTGKLSYVPQSYHAYGNNGNCFDNRVDAYDCEGTYPLPLRQNLYNMSDHLPIVLQLKTNKTFETVNINAIPSNDITLVSGNIIHDFLAFHWTMGNNLNADFVLTNSQGQNIKPIVHQNGNTIKIDCRHLSAGIYFLRCISQRTVQIKFIKL